MDGTFFPRGELIGRWDFLSEGRIEFYMLSSVFY